MEFNPIWDTTRHRPDMDKVKVVFGVRPVLGDIVDFKLAIRRDKWRLDGRQVHTDNFGRWMFISELAIAEQRQ